MGTLIDSSVLIAAERGRLDLQAALASRADDPVRIAAITASEVLQGTYRLGGVRLAQARAFVERWLTVLPVVPFNLRAAQVHATLAADLGRKGTPMGAHDLNDCGDRRAARLRRRHLRPSQLQPGGWTCRAVLVERRSPGGPPGLPVSSRLAGGPRPSFSPNPDRRGPLMGAGGGARRTRRACRPGGGYDRERRRHHRRDTFARGITLRSSVDTQIRPV